MATVVAGVAYAIYLVPTGAGLHPSIVASSVVLGLAAVLTLALSLTGAHRPGSASDSDRRGRWGFALAVAALLTRRRLGFGHCRGRGARTVRLALPARRADGRRAFGLEPGDRHLARIGRASRQPCPAGRSVETAETSAQVSQDVVATGREYLPVGGFTGQVPATSVRQLEADVRGRARRGRAGLGCTPDAQPGHAMGPRALPGGTSLLHQDGATYRRVLCLPSDATP